MSSPPKDRHPDGPPTPPGALIFGCAGTVLGAEEQAFFATARPFGFILFTRNCQNAAQITTLTAALRAAAGRPRAPVLIDQEGGRVARLPAPPWPRFPAAGRLGQLAASDRGQAKRAAWLHGRLLAHSLLPLGVDVDCLPVLDVPVAGADPIIGDRAFAEDPALVAELGGAQMAGLRAGGVMPVIKHLPGHGRARVDSHLRLPRTDASAETLENSDFRPFQALAPLAPLGMTAHMIYSAFDADRPATLSPIVIREVIRKKIGFKGILMSDDISMKALSGPLETRAGAAFAAGCDLVLHCNGKLDEMRRLAAVAPPLSPRALEIWEKARSVEKGPDPSFSEKAAWRELDAALSARA